MRIKIVILVTYYFIWSNKPVVNWSVRKMNEMHRLQIICEENGNAGIPKSTGMDESVNERI